VGGIFGVENTWVPKPGSCIIGLFYEPGTVGLFSPLSIPRVISTGQGSTRRRCRPQENFLSYAFTCIVISGLKRLGDCGVGL
jgi:hypothetical protein